MNNYNEFITLMGDRITSVSEKPKRLYFEVNDKDIKEIAEYLFRKLGCRLSTATGTETYRGIEVLYHFSDDKTGEYYSPRVVITDKKNPRMNSITPVIRGAEWIEREMSEMLGITFEGHPRPEPLLTGNHPKNIKVPLRKWRSNG